MKLSSLYTFMRRHKTLMELITSWPSKNVITQGAYGNITKQLQNPIPN